MNVLFLLRNAFGATSPPFIDYLKEILRRYPDGGQILKELIQNADDAKASEIVFIYDERRYGTGSVWREALGKYQGRDDFLNKYPLVLPQHQEGEE
ncbi:sacsin-like [Astyanax mexicanus]|uniref:sacsin-like n=1 Tax=Astyanax mexicanus TaxID=7994 RepID=UPI0020CB04DE|nr:sacsin-like [Astyanax mexicanus]